MKIVINNLNQINIEEQDHDFILSFDGRCGNIITICVQRRFLEEFKEQLNNYL